MTGTLPLARTLDRERIQAAQTAEDRAAAHKRVQVARHGDADESRLRRCERDQLLGELGVYPDDGARFAHHGAVVFRCGEDAELPELPFEHGGGLSHPADSGDSDDEDAHGARCDGADGKWRVDVRFARCVFLRERERDGRDAYERADGRRDLESRWVSQ